MRFGKFFTRFALLAGLALPASSVLMAQDWDSYRDRRDLREDKRDVRSDYRRVDRMRADIARDRWRLDQDIRYGRSQAAAADARDLARDQAALNAMLRDIDRDKDDIRYDRQDLRRDSYWRYR